MQSESSPLQVQGALLQRKQRHRPLVSLSPGPLLPLLPCPRATSPGRAEPTKPAARQSHVLSHLPGSPGSRPRARDRESPPGSARQRGADSEFGTLRRSAGQGRPSPRLKLPATLWPHPATGIKVPLGWVYFAPKGSGSERGRRVLPARLFLPGPSGRPTPLPRDLNWWVWGGHLFPGAVLARGLATAPALAPSMPGKAPS